MRGDADAPAGQRGERADEARAFLAEQRFGRNAHAVERQVARVAGVDAELFRHALDRHPGRRTLDQERADAVRTGTAGAKHAHHDRGVAAVGAPLLATVQNVAVAVAARGRAKIGGIGADLGLGQRKARDAVAGREQRKPAFPLAWASEAFDRRTDHRVNRERHRRAGVDAGEFLDRERVRDVAGARAAELLRNEDAHHSSLRELRIELSRKRAVAVPLRDERRDLAARDVPGQIRNVALLGRQFELLRIHA